MNWLRRMRIASLQDELDVLVARERNLLELIKSNGGGIPSYYIDRLFDAREKMAVLKARLKRLGA